MKNVLYILAVGCFLFMVGTVGGMENYNIGVGQGALRCFAGLLGMIVCINLAERLNNRNIIRH